MSATSTEPPVIAPLATGARNERAALRQRTARLPADLARVLAAGPPPVLPARLAQARRFEVTGIGASEGPARLLANTLLEAGRLARFVPVASFTESRGDPESALLVFSQGLSPNALLPLRQSARFGASALFTATPPPGTESSYRSEVLREFVTNGGLVWSHPPDAETGTLVRLVGPSCAFLASLRFVSALLGDERSLDFLAELERVPDATRRRGTTAAPSPKHARAAFVGLGVDASLLSSLAWKWQEALYTPLPPSFDVLSFVHGPLQSLDDAPTTLLLCKGAPTKASRDLLERFRRVLHGTGHHLVELDAQLPGPLAWFEFDVTTTLLILDEMERRDLDPSVWPARDRDPPLYTVGEFP